MADLEKTINQAISDFNEIESAIEEMGIDVPTGTDTKEYGNLIRKIPSGGITVDQSYNGESENPQSGIAVAEALSALPIKYVVSPDKDGNTLYLRDLESGTYVLQGSFKPNAVVGNVCRFSSNLLVNVVKGTLNKVPTSHIQIFYPVHNVVQFVDVTDDTYKRTDISLNDLAETATVEEMIATANKAEQEIYGNSLKATASGEVIRVDGVSPIEHTAKVKVRGKNLISYPYSDTTKTVAGITFTDNGNGSVTVRGTATSQVFFNVKLRDIAVLVKSGIYTLSGTPITASEDTYYMYAVTENDKPFHDYGQSKTFSLSKDEKLRFFIVIQSGVTLDETFYPMLENSDTATEYEPYLDPTTVTVTRYGVDESDNMQTYTPNEDGTLDIPSLSPTMTLLTDTAGVNIEVEYNQDVNVAMGNVKADLTEADRMIAELSEDMGDVETALDNIIAIQNNLLGVSE